MGDTAEKARDLRRLLNGYQVSAALHVAARLRVPDLLAERPQTAAELATATDTHAPSLLRLLRALTTIGVFAQSPDGRFSNTDLGAAFCSGAPAGLGEWAALIGREHYWHAWGALGHSVRTGENAFMATHGMSVWDYRAERPEELEVFNAAMTGMTHAVVAGVVEAYDFSRFGTVADIGGGHGALLASVLQRYPAVRGIVFDQPAVVAGAEEALTRAAVGDRCTLVGGNFFDAVPAGADAYVLKAVIHDWTDEESVSILRRCRDAAGDDATLLLVEQLVDRAPDPARTAFSDLNMLVMPGGQERTVDEYAALLAAAGWTLAKIVPTATDVFVIEATPG